MIHSTKISKLFKRLLFALILTPLFSFAQVDTDWGIISTDGSYTYNFSNTDITKNFTDNYYFTLDGSNDTQYQMTLVYDSCTYGCGNLAIDYGIYDGNTLIDDTGTTTLSSGTYNLQITGTGMGAGNNVNYSGTITFTPMVAIVSTVPEPSEVILFTLSAILLAGSIARHRRSQRKLLLT